LAGVDNREDFCGAEDTIDLSYNGVEVSLVFRLRPKCGFFNEAIELVLPSSVFADLELW
jgi:hypothetical protein